MITTLKGVIVVGKDDGLGYIEAYGEIIPITWSQYLAISWHRDEDIVIVKIPDMPKK